MSELPLNDKPPRVPVSTPKIRSRANHLSGLASAVELIDDLKLQMPGLKLAKSAITVELERERCWLLSKLHQISAKAGVDLSQWCVSGIAFDGDEMIVEFISMMDVDKEKP